LDVSVVIRSKDEADRLRLTLTSLARQSEAAEVVVVNDGSSDHTRAVLEEAAGWLPLTVIHHGAPRGRSEASNAGARAASGEVLLFLDGDTLAGPDLVRRTKGAHAARGGMVGRGEVFHLRHTRFLKDPQTAEPWPHQAERVGRMPSAERERLKVTRDQVLEDFEAVTSRAEAGVYPGAGPRELHERELDALRHHPDCAVLWATATGSNLSTPRTAFLEVGGFHEGGGYTEHRELALKLCQAGLRMRLIEDASTYHLTHRNGWRDPLQEADWELIFYHLHPIRAVKLLAVFWASVTPNNLIPAGAKISSLPALELAARGDNGVDYDAVRARLGLQPLP
jgi:glycosyltransferase involved in cell wall biosynthesis